MKNIAFDTMNLESTSLQFINNLKQFGLTNHLQIINDRFQYNKEKDQLQCILQTSYKLFHRDSNLAIELSVESTFVPHNIPPVLSDYQEMVKCHFFHSEAILFDKLKTMENNYFSEILFFERSYTKERGDSLLKSFEIWFESYKY